MHHFTQYPNMTSVIPLLLNNLL